MATMRRLVLIRHATAEAHRRDDRSRELSPQGLEDAAAVGRWLAQQQIRPDRVVVSSSIRTRQTWEQTGIADPGAVYDERVYENAVEDLLEVLGDTPQSVGTLVLVGHNPGIERLAFHLVDGAVDGAVDDSTRGRMASGFPTSAVAVLAMTSWTGPGRLEDFAVPRG